MLTLSLIVVSVLTSECFKKQHVLIHVLFSPESCYWRWTLLYGKMLFPDKHGFSNFLLQLERYIGFHYYMVKCYSWQYGFLQFPTTGRAVYWITYLLGHWTGRYVWYSVLNWVVAVVFWCLETVRGKLHARIGLIEVASKALRGMVFSVTYPW